MKTYEGRREGYAAIVTVDGAPLNPRLDLWNHSPTGFEWGYAGSGPAQLALAILTDHLVDDNEAVALHQEFKRVVVAGLCGPGWTLTGEQVHAYVVLLRENQRPPMVRAVRRTYGRLLHDLR
jgi:hypothetical protein